MSFITKLFGGGSVSKVEAPATPAAPAPAPTIDQAAVNQDAADRMRRRRGARSTIMVGDGAAPSATKSVLG